jgi:hypothetical protein
MEQNLTLIKDRCDYLDGLYTFNQKTKNLISSTLPFDLIYKNGTMFSTEGSSELKSDEEQLLKKAVNRIGEFKDTDYNLRWFIPVKTFFHEKSDKIKLYHGLVYRKDLSSSTELTWITINGKVIDMSNEGGFLKGSIPDTHIYYGIEIPREIAKDAIFEYGFGLEIDPQKYLFMPNATTIFMKSLKNLIKHYGHGNKNNQ